MHELKIGYNQHMKQCQDYINEIRDLHKANMELDKENNKLKKEIELLNAKIQHQDETIRRMTKELFAYQVKEKAQ